MERALKLVISKYTHGITTFRSEIHRFIHLLHEMGVQFSFELWLNSFQVDLSAEYRAESMQVEAELVVDKIQLNALNVADD